LASKNEGAGATNTKEIQEEEKTTRRKGKGGKMKRIQRKRTKGWKMPANTVNIARPSHWGNPFPIAVFGRDECLRLYRQWLKQTLADDPFFLDPLKGKDLACFCPLDKPCHGDVILEFLENKI